MFVIPSAVHRRRHYLLGRPFTVITDHKSLSQLLSQTIQTPEQQKWLTKLTKLLGFDFQTCYKPGSQNNVADALSRWTADATMKAISSPCFNIIDEIRRLTSTDLSAQHIISQLANSDDLQSKYRTRNGLLLKGSRIYVPANVGLQQQLIRTYYGSKEGGHSEEGKDLNKSGNGSELVLDGGFVVPDANTFGQTFRDYEGESERRDLIEEFYRLNHIHQSVQFVKQMREKYGKLNTAEMSIWECCELLNDIVDESDPDLDEPQIEHLLQTAEAIRRDYPDEDWLHLTGLIHDLGKVLSHPKFGALPQWAVVGDTFPVGCAFDKSNIHWKYFEGNEDWNNPIYNTKNGIYSEGCGLENVLMSWGHDDYMYLVAKENKTTLPSAALFIIRYHSFYPLHKFGAYRHLMNDEDRENMKWLQLFNKYDLYSKSKVRIDVEKVKPYYLSLIEKYFPAKLRW